MAGQRRQPCTAATSSSKSTARSYDLGGPEVMTWFWEETLAGDLVRQVRDRMEASENPQDKAIAFGIARG